MMTMRLEIFVKDLAASVNFYCRVLGFEKVLEKADGYTIMKKGAAQVDLQPLSDLEDNHPVRPRPKERVGLGIEIVLEVDDVDSCYQHVIAQGWPLSSPLLSREWGLIDFRVLDPDGHYIRITSRYE